MLKEKSWKSNRVIQVDPRKENFKYI